jgi:hypothetical protein
MYDRHIEVQEGLVFVSKINHIIMDIKNKFPTDVTFYIEYEGDWWIERKPFVGREKNEDIRKIALEIFSEAEKQMENLELKLQVQETEPSQ